MPMQISSRVRLLSFVVGLGCFAAYTVVVQERFEVLQRQVNELQAELSDAQYKLSTAPLADEEKETFQEFMDSLPDEERRETGVKIAKMPTVARLDAMRQYPAHPPAGLHPSKKRREAKNTLQDLRLLDSAIDQYTIETCKVPGVHPVFADLKNYLKPGSTLYESGADVFGNAYGPFTVDSIPLVPDATFNALSDVAGESFWKPYR